jgi:Caspase domain
MTARVIAKYLAAIAFSLWSAGLSAQAERRVALVIGNAAYQNTPALGNPVNDADDMAAALQRVGFTVQIERDLSKRGMEGALARFARLAEDADTAMFFYAGHGIQYRGTNYLMPVDARMDDEISITYELLRIDDVMFSLERARGVKLLVLDACRNNPLLDRLVRRGTTRDAGASRGLARVDARGGMVIAYSTQADQVAVDGTGRNSPFTSALVKYIAEPGLEVGSLFRRVAIEVDRATGGRQLPELWVTLRSEFYLNGRETDLQAWSKIRTSDDPNQLSGFIRTYPDSVLAPEVRQRLEAIERGRADRERVERERREQSGREQVEQERERLARELARERVERERLAGESAAREQADRERLERERVTREQTAREQAARDQIERERVAREQADRERLAREQAERERLAREQVERERIEREQAARPVVQPPANPQIAMLPPPSEPGPPSNAVLVQDIKKELKRIGCLAGALDGKWATADTQASIAKFVRFAKLATAPEQPTNDFLDALRRTGPRVCPLECGVRQIEKNGACVAKICPRGSVLQRDGECEEVRKRSRTAARPPAAEAPARKEMQRQPESGAARPSRAGGQEAVICNNRGCRSGTWSQQRIPGARCRRLGSNRHQLFCN